MEGHGAGTGWGGGGERALGKYKEFLMRVCMCVRSVVVGGG